MVISAREPLEVRVWDMDMKELGTGTAQRIPGDDPRVPESFKDEMPFLYKFAGFTMITLKDESVVWGRDVWISPIDDREPPDLQGRRRSALPEIGSRQPVIPNPTTTRKSRSGLTPPKKRGRQRVSVDELKKRRRTRAPKDK